MWALSARFSRISNLKSQISDFGRVLPFVLACVWTCAAPAAAPLPGTLKPLKGAPQPSSPFLGTVYKYADALVKQGRDTYGPQKTGLFLSALDREKVAPLESRPPAPTGIREEERPGPADGPLVGANPMYDETLLLTLRILRGLSGNAAYTQAANEQVQWFLTHAPLEGSGLLPWATGMGWDVMADKPVPDKASLRYPWPRPWTLWHGCGTPHGGFKPGEPTDCSCYGLAPEQSVRFATALLKHRRGVANTRTDVRQMGYDLRTWAAAYAHTKDKQFLDAVETTLRHFDSPVVRCRLDPVSVWLSASVDCYGASILVPEPLASQLRAFSTKEDQRFCSLKHDLGGHGGFFQPGHPETGKALTEPRFTPLWDPKAARDTTAAVGMLCVARYENGGIPCLRKLLIEAAQAYLKSDLPQDEDLWPLTVGQVISLEMAAWRATADRIYFDRAVELGHFAVKAFWGDAPLPRASLKSQHYENLTGADTLATSLLELHLSILHITAVPHPSNTMDR